MMCLNKMKNVPPYNRSRLNTDIDHMAFNLQAQKLLSRDLYNVVDINALSVVQWQAESVHRASTGHLCERR